MPGAPLGEHQRSPEQDGQDERRDEDQLQAQLARVVEEVARQVNGQKENREQRRDRQQGALFHSTLSWSDQGPRGVKPLSWGLPASAQFE
jgi:hypothetical protein